MKITKKEVDLLQVGAGFLFLVFAVVSVFMGALKERDVLQGDLELQRTQYEAVQQLISAPVSTETIHELKCSLTEKFTFFQEAKDSYAVDILVNELTQVHSLELLELSIAPSRAVESSTLISEDTAPDSAFEPYECLTASTVSVSVKGTYQDLLAFADALYELGDSVRVQSFGLLFNEREQSETPVFSSNIMLDIYGVTVPDFANIEVSILGKELGEFENEK